MLFGGAFGGGGGKPAARQASARRRSRGGGRCRTGQLLVLLAGDAWDPARSISAGERGEEQKGWSTQERRPRLTTTDERGKCSRAGGRCDPVERVIERERTVTRHHSHSVSRRRPFETNGRPARPVGVARARSGNDAATTFRRRRLIKSTRFPLPLNLHTRAGASHTSKPPSLRRVLYPSGRDNRRKEEQQHKACSSRHKARPQPARAPPCAPERRKCGGGARGRCCWAWWWRQGCSRRAPEGPGRRRRENQRG